MKGGRAERIRVSGVIQGVGFRPFVFREAEAHGLKGWVKNTGAGVEIHIESRDPRAVPDFLSALEKNQPPLSKIETVSHAPAAFRGHRNFRILKSKPGAGVVFISPDIATCAACLEEIRDPAERRCGYAFTNCTDCGPRYTIVRSLPYDRPGTTMARFPMCPDCAREYGDPRDRRYHAQPIACPACGPRLTLRDARSGRRIPGGLEAAAELIRKGRILAVKGIGGFHLMASAFDRTAVRRIRDIKQRKRKPLALMAPDLETAARAAFIGPEEKALLLSARRPIVLLQSRGALPLIAPHLHEVGIMLPYTPLHALLLEKTGLVVATSSNPKDAPIMTEEKEGLADLCDAVLSHNRPIAMRADDSVLKASRRGPLFVRRARGYVPSPQPVPEFLKSRKTILALGGELKVAVSLYKDGSVVTSQFLGDLDDYRNFRYFEETVDHLKALFGAAPDIVVSDLHPDFRTTRYARSLGIPHLQVQHHFAHVLAPLLEHGLRPREKVLGVAFDGYGYGPGGEAWGGEFLLADYTSYERYAHLEDVPLPGGDLAARQPWRMAASYLRRAFGEDFPREALRGVGRTKIEAVAALLASGRPGPKSSSCGRLFDAVSFLCGLSPMTLEYEAEAAMRLEAAVSGPARGRYPIDIQRRQKPLSVSFRPMIRRILEDLGRGVPAAGIAAKFHETLARLIVRIAETARDERGVTTVVLVGGVFLNRVLLERTENLLEANGFHVLRPVRYSPNDESLSLGQIAFALAREGRTELK